MRGWACVALVVLYAATACSQPSSATAPAADKPATPIEKKPLRPLAQGDSNIARADYIGPEACAECHAAQFALWTTSLHRVMNAKVDATGASVDAAGASPIIGDFTGVVLKYRDGEARFQRDAAGYTMTTRD